MWRVVATTALLLLLGQYTFAFDHGPSPGQRNVFTRNMRDFSVADQGRFWGGSLGWGVPFAKPRTVRPSWSGMVLGLGKRSPARGSLYQGAPSLEDTGMLMGMGKRAASMMEPVRPPRNPRWNRHHRIQRGEPEDARREDMEEMETLMPEEEKEEMVELMEKRSGLTLPTPNVEDTGMLMGMGKRASGTKEFVFDGGLSSGFAS